MTKTKPTLCLPAVLWIILAATLMAACAAATPAGPAGDSPEPAIPLIGPSLPANFPMTQPVLAADPYRLGGPAPAGSNDYWVDGVNGSDSASGTSVDQAWKSLDRLHKAAFKPGDIIHLARGSVWVNQLLLLDHNYSGTASLPITFQAYGTGAAPTISQPRALWDKSKEITGILVGGTSSFIHILDLKVELTSLANGISVADTCHDIVIAGCEIQNCNTGIGLGGEHQKILGNFIHDIGSAGGTSGIGICYVGRDLEMAWNRLENCQARSTVGDLGVDGGAFEFYNYRSDVGYNYQSDQILIHHNVICGCLNFMEAFGNVTGMRIYYNVYLNGPNEALEFHFDDCEHEVWTITPSYEVTIENNTFVPNASDRKQGWGIIGLLVDWVTEHNPDPAKNKVTFRNNLFVTNYRVVAFKNVLGASLVHDHNLYVMLEDGRPSNDSAGFVLDASEQLFDAKHPGSAGFADAAARDFRLAAGSPAIDRGTAAPANLDILGLAVPAGGAADIGAYEFQ